MDKNQIIKLARTNFKVFIRLVMPEFKFGQVHHILIETLERAIKREDGYTRICLSMPPRQGKSTICSILFPAWAIGYSASIGKTEEVMALSYAADLSEEFGVKVRKICQSKLYEKIFPETSIVLDKNTGGRKINFPNESIYRATGILGSVTGKGSTILLIDDPIKNREQAESKARIKKLKSAFGNDLYSRLEPGAIVIIIHTRWNNDDLIGYVLEQYAHVDWKVIRFAALCDDEENDPLGRKLGEPLCPFRTSLERYLEIKAGLENVADWYALYQNNPIKASKTYWKPKYLNKIDLLPVYQYEQIYCTWDCASELTSTSDYTAVCVWGLIDGNIHKIIDEKRKVEFSELIEFVEEYDQKYLPHIHIVEKASNGIPLLQYAEKNLPEINMESYSAHKNKGHEFTVAAKVYMNVFFNNDMPGDQEETLEQLSKWPSTKHDDLAISHLIGVRYFQDELKEGTSTVNSNRRPNIYKVQTVKRNRRSKKYEKLCGYIK